MAEYVTRQFADKTTGAPIIGGDYRLASVADAGATAVVFIECTDPLYPGRYTSEDPVPMGVYSVERNEGAGFLPTGEEISVAPGRTAVGALGGADGRTVLDIVIGDVVHATAFVPEAATSPTTAHLQAAILYAEDNSLKKVYVGAFKGVSNWAGGQVVIAEPNMEIDLGGAKVMRTDATGSVFDVQADAGGGDGNFVHFRNGDIVGFTGLTPESNDYAEINSTCRVLCSHVRFPRWPGGAARGIAATVQNGAGYIQAHFHECLGHVLWGDTDRAHTRIQTSNTTCLQTSGVASPLGFYPAGLANVPESELGAMFGALMAGATTTAPSDAVAPFDTGESAGRALKHLFFEEKPKIDAVFPSVELCDQAAVYKAAGRLSYTPWVLFWGGSTNEAPLYAQAVAGRVDVPSDDVDPGYIVRKYFRPGATSYSKIEIEGFVAMNSTGLEDTVSSEVGYLEPIGWFPRAVSIDFSVVPELLRDKDGIAVIAASDWGIESEVALVSAITDASGANAIGLKGSSGQIVSSVVSIDVGSILLNDGTEPYLGMLAHPAMPLPSGYCLAKIKVVLTNKTRTDLPRFL